MNGCYVSTHISQKNTEYTHKSILTVAQPRDMKWASITAIFIAKVPHISVSATRPNTSLFKRHINFL